MMIFHSLQLSHAKCSLKLVYSEFNNHVMFDNAIHL